MKKLLLILVISLLACCFFSLSISAAATNEFGTVETSDTIDLTGMSTDSNARVVLFDGTEYHTYPSQYIVTDKGDMSYDFNKINADFEKSYAINSVIRIEIPNTVKVIVGGLFNYGKNDNLKEVFFPADSTVYKWNWGSFEGNKGLEKINFPASLTEFHGSNHFAKCSSLKYITFDEGYSVNYLPANFFQSCSSLEELILPNCITELRGGTFSSCAKLKKVVLGANLQTMQGAMSDCATSGSVWYLPASFYASSVESEPPSNMFHWDGKNNNAGTTSGNHNNPKNITFVYTGTKEQAMALQARFKAADAAVGENCIGLKRLWDATLCSIDEYKELTGKNVGEYGVTGYYLVYGYNACDAFYNGEHDIPSMEMNFNSYLEEITYGGTCTQCTQAVIDESCTIGAIFTWYGYSCTENDFPGTRSIAQFFGVNKANLAKYEEATGIALSYGVVATGNVGGEEISPFDKNNYVTSHQFTSYPFEEADVNCFSIKINGITDVHYTTKFIFCAYVKTGDTVVYLDQGRQVYTLCGLCYNETLKLKK